MLRILLIRPGATAFDEQGRIKGSLSIPLSENGIRQVETTVDDLKDEPVKVIYAAPCIAAQQTAELLSEQIESKVKKVDKLRNLDRGLWHGKLVEELLATHPKLYKQWQEDPESVCPPGGEAYADAKERIEKCLKRIIRKHSDDETIAIVAAEPVATLIQVILGNELDRDMLQRECQCGIWNQISVAVAEIAG